MGQGAQRYTTFPPPPPPHNPASRKGLASTAVLVGPEVERPERDKGFSEVSQRVRAKLGLDN